MPLFVGEPYDDSEQFLRTKFPDVPESIKERAYQPSGKCPVSGMGLMLSLGLPSGVILGLLEAGITALTSDLGIETLLAFVGWIAVNFLFPSLLGVGLGAWMSQLVIRGRCRNGLVAGLIVCLCAVPAILIPEIWVDRGFLKYVDLLLLILPALWMTVLKVRTQPYCELCDRYYDPPKFREFAIPVATFLVCAVQQGDFSILEQVDLTERESVWSFPNPFYGQLQSLDIRDYFPPKLKIQAKLKVELASCQCSEADHHLFAEVWHKRDVIMRYRKTGEVGVKQKENVDTWFTTMLPPQAGNMLKDKLFSDTEGSNPDRQ